MTTVALCHTLAFAKRLKKAGCEPKLADEHAEAHTEILINLLENALLTQDDMRQRLLKVERLANPISNPEDKFNSQFSYLKNKLNVRFSHLEDRLSNLPTLLFPKLAGVIISSITFIGIIIGILARLHTV